MTLFFEENPVDYFLENQLPAVPGRYKYMPYHAQATITSAKLLIRMARSAATITSTASHTISPSLRLSPTAYSNSPIFLRWLRRRVFCEVAFWTSKFRNPKRRVVPLSLRQFTVNR
jgi:hypothetical protein